MRISVSKIMMGLFFFFALLLSVQSLYADAPPEVPVKGMVTMIDLGAKKCIPCKMMEPILEELKVEYAGVLRIEFIDVQVDPETAVKLGVRGIPTQIFYDASGKERYRHMGYISKENILAAFKKLGVALVRKDGGKKGK